MITTVLKCLKENKIVDQVDMDMQYDNLQVYGSQAIKRDREKERAVSKVLYFQFSGAFTGLMPKAKTA